MIRKQQQQADPAGDALRRDRLTVALVNGLVGFAMDVPTAEIEGRKASAPGARARQTAMYLAHVVLGWRLDRAARAWGRDRTTAGYAVKLIEDLRDDRRFDERLSTLEACVRQAVDAEGASA